MFGISLIALNLLATKYYIKSISTKNDMFNKKGKKINIKNGLIILSVFNLIPGFVFLAIGLTWPLIGSLMVLVASIFYKNYPSPLNHSIPLPAPSPTSTTVRHCNKCGKPTIPGDSFCRGCGNKLE